VGITGISAGGYTTLQCLTRHPATFAGGVCASGISELKGFDELTHKLEMDYTAALVLRDGLDEAEQEAVLRERSALYHADKVRSPLVLIHGVEDTIVPLSQARMMAEALEGRVDVRLVEVEGDGHSLGLPRSAKIWLREEESWWRKTLLRAEG
jgi:dipeptidyl aminopeptidase/acylaminoacyl peptidase